MKADDSHMISSLPSTVPALGPQRRLSSIIEELCARAESCITVQQIRDALGDRSFSTLLLFFALLNLLPLPPGSTLILGLPLILVSLQMVGGRHSVWLPQFLLGKSLQAEQFQKMAVRIVPRLQWLEALVRPRYWPFADPKTAERIIGIAAFVLAMLVTLPIPFGNWFPALACALLGLALSERDGILLAAAGLVIIISVVILGAVFETAGIMAGMIFS